MDDNKKYYKGMTSDLNRRLKEHKSGQTQSTKNLINPRVVYTENHSTLEKVRERELYLKTSAGRRFLKKILRD